MLRLSSCLRGILSLNWSMIFRSACGEGGVGGAGARRAGTADQRSVPGVRGVYACAADGCNRSGIFLLACFACFV